MQIVSADIAIAKDIRNVIHREDLTVPELALLQIIHGMEAVSNIRVTGKAKNFNGHKEMDRLQHAYSKHANDVVGIFRDFGGKFPTNIGMLRLGAEQIISQKMTADDYMEMDKRLREVDGEIDDEPEVA